MNTEPLIKVTGRLLDVCGRAVREREDLAQLRQLQGECGELIAAICDYDRGRISRERVRNEIADVLLLVTQFLLRDGDDAMTRALHQSLDRLEEVLRGERG